MRKVEEAMIKIKDTLISLDIIEKKFVCDLTKCKGACCVHGDSGAPIEDHEVEILEQIYPKLKSYLRQEGINAIEEQGTWIIDIENDKVTPLINNQECAYVVFEDDIAKCAIEKAYFDKKIKFQKPVSCHLYPVRVKKYSDFFAVNYDSWEICKPALKLGKDKDVPVFEFTKESLLRKFGKDWYRHLRIVAKELAKNKENP